MTRRRTEVSLGDMRDFMRDAITISKGKTFDDLQNDREFYLASVKSIELIAEASNRLGKEFQAQHPDIPWKEIIGMRNRLVHDYDRIEIQVVWETLTIEIPSLFPKIEKLAPPTLRPRNPK